MLSRQLMIFVMAIVTFSCNSGKKKALQSMDELIMVEQSEMAKLMNEMYAFNQSIKQQIADGELKAGFPNNFNQIHTAILTDPSDRDSIFESFSFSFLEDQKSIFDAPPEELKQRYNNAVNACISCHSQKCTGPIPKIKKLLIK